MTDIADVNPSAIDGVGVCLTFDTNCRHMGTAMKHLVPRPD